MAKIAAGSALRRNPFFLQDVSLNTHDDAFHGDLPLGSFGGLPGQIQESRAAGNLHDHDRKGVDFRIFKPGFDLLDIDILPFVQFGAGNGQGFALQIIPMEISQGVRHAICGEENIGSLIVGGRGRDEVELYGPLPQMRQELPLSLFGALVILLSEIEYP